MYFINFFIKTSCFKKFVIGDGWKKVCNKVVSSIQCSNTNFSIIAPFPPQYSQVSSHPSLPFGKLISYYLLQEDLKEWQIEISENKSQSI